jgi:hypothetical protein
LKDTRFLIDDLRIMIYDPFLDNNPKFPNWSHFSNIEH